MPRFAENTSVSIEASKAEIEETLRLYRADGFCAGWHKGQGLAMVAFEFEGRQVRFTTRLPDRDSNQFTRTDTGRTREPEAAMNAWERAQRQQWRALALIVKAKLESVEVGVETFEQTFLAHLVLPDGGTVGNRLVPQIVNAIEGGQMTSSTCPRPDEPHLSA